MWSRLVAWIMACLTALMNNFGFYQPEEYTYTGSPGYAIQEDIVDYKALREDYIRTLNGRSDICIVNAKENTGLSYNNNGFAHIVAGTPINPDAQMIFSDEDVIIAPSACKVTTQPSTGATKIVVESDAAGINKFKMEINSPKKWFCCQDLETPESGYFLHSQTDHRIELKQGDTICVASSDTTIRLWRGNKDGDLQQCATYRDFLLSDSSETGDSSQLIGGGTEQIITDGSTVRIDSSKIYQGQGTWHQDANGWWYGVSGTDYAAGQYVVYQSGYYYMDDAGYMVTGWNEDGYYFSPETDITSPRLYPDKKEGQLLHNTLVLSEDGSHYVFVGLNGQVEQNQNHPTGTVVAVNETSFQCYEHGKYRLTTSSGPVSAGAQGNSQGGSDISTQDGEYAWEYSGGNWVLLKNGSKVERQGTSLREYNTGQSFRKLRVDGVYYLFYDDGTLCVEQNKLLQFSSTEWYINNGANGVYADAWIDGPEAETWYYATGDGTLYINDKETINGVEYYFDLYGLYRKGVEAPSYIS